jgi:hypothetical protein
MLLTSAVLSVAIASPRFLADEAPDAVVAERAWAAAVACTGWDPSEGDQEREVELTRSVIPGGWLGRAHVDDDERLVRIDVSAPAARVREVIVHEVAHAWVSEGDQALVEGSAELLADCMVSQDLGLAPLQFDDGRDLVAMSDLRQWAIAAEGKPLAMDGARTDAYLGAARLLRTAASVIGHDVLWGREPVTWSAVEAALEAAGAPAASILEVVRADPATQREALADADRDGLTDLHEALLGTDPARFDSDGDGWWDGALERPADALVVPLDGTPTCTAAAPGAKPLPGGNLRGLDVPGLALTPLASGVALLALDGTSMGTSGGLWAQVEGSAPVAGCATSLRRTVAATTPEAVAHTEAVAQRLDAALDAVTSRFGPTPTRTAVLLGGEVTGYDGHVVRLGQQELDRAAASGTLDELVRTAAALPVVWRSGDSSWRDAVALGRSLASR